ncbi:Uncharacterised protein [Mycobacteroides abscessus subsp. abscessus]|nr:hypothetical protein [Mycobacteroides abscessus]SIK24942.1 Uncharacterised protein [Mycobacteroides abscessus subsp. abscessus]SLC57489.1 Uncharacterised protein [Mycobacteroides abscessus subsp. massiliense]SIL67930.1 Uncharacterised protein [Mycobacteroides abscessus subsp. abscessus]SIM47212.1 Uncharacterised protein [Mycobacteroides abscessus subsp. abscessus]
MGAFGERRGELRCWSIVGRVLAALWIALGIAIACGVGVPESASLAWRIMMATMFIGTAVIPVGCVMALRSAMYQSDADTESDRPVR